MGTIGRESHEPLPSTYHLVWGVVRFQLLVVGVLHKDGMIPDHWCD